MVKFKKIHFKEFFSNALLTYDTLTCPYLKLWAWAPTGSPCRNPPTAVLTPCRLRFLSPSGSSSILTQGNTTVTCFLIRKDNNEYNRNHHTIVTVLAFVDFMNETLFWEKFQKLIYKNCLSTKSDSNKLTFANSLQLPLQGDELNWVHINPMP